jgi:hypothetical protein
MARTFTSGGAGTDAVVVTSYAATEGLASISVSLWAKRTGDGGAGNGRYVGKGTTGALDIYCGANIITIEAKRWSTTNGVWHVTKPSNSVWHHLLVTYSYSATTNVPVVYLDGVAVTVTTDTAPVGTATDDDTLIWTVGNVAGIRAFDGDEAEFGVFARIATAANAIALAGGVAPDHPTLRASLVLYLPISPNAAFSPEPNVAEGRRANTGAVTGTSQAAHPTVPIVRRLLHGHAALAGGR